MPVLIFVGLFLIVLASMAIGSYNGLIRLRNQVERAWSNIDVILKQRFEEIPQLIQVIEQFTSYEGSVIKHLVEARANYGSARSVSEKIKASQEMTLALSGVMAIGEQYPELKSSESFRQLQERISSLENAIADRRETYNDAVANFNTRIEQFPDVFAARFLNYQRQELFKAAAEEREKPNLKMNIPKLGQSA
jgi:LemA protein